MAECPYIGPERRLIDQWRTSVEERVERMENTLECIKRNTDQFHNGYGDLLRELLESRARKEKLKTAAMERLVSGGIWGVVIFIGFACWEWLRTHIR